MLAGRSLGSCGSFPGKEALVGSSDNVLSPRRLRPFDSARLECDGTNILAPALKVEARVVLTGLRV